MHNSLKRVILDDLESIEPPEQEHHWKTFQDSCLYRGVAGALSLMPEEVRTKYEAAIASCSSDLWRPEKIWSALPGSFKQIGLIL